MNPHVDAKASMEVGGRVVKAFVERFRPCRWRPVLEGG